MPAAGGRTPLAAVVTGAAFTAVGVLHFVAPAAFQSIVPPWVPHPAAAVAVSGIAEIAGGLGLLSPRTRRAAAYGLLALLVAVYPANVHMALNAERYGIPAWVLFARLPLQPLLALLVWSLARR